MSSLSTMTERIDAATRFALAYAVLSIIVILSVVALPYPFTSAVKPPLFLIVIYYWCLYRPRLLPVWLVFAVGIVLDLIGGGYLGLHALVFVIVRWIISDQRRFLMSQSFIVVWIVFCLVAISVGMVQWVIFGLANGTWGSLQPVLFSVFLGIMLFPPVSLILQLTLKILPQPEQETDVSTFSVSRRKKI